MRGDRVPAEPILSVEEKILRALDRIARALEAQVKATELLASATAGEFEPEDGPAPRSLGERV